MIEERGGERSVVDGGITTDGIVEEAPEEHEDHRELELDIEEEPAEGSIP